MAGLGETCTHVAAVLFYLEAFARLQGNQTSTQRKCAWIISSYLKNVEYLPVKIINFTSARKRKKNIDTVLDRVDDVLQNNTTSSKVCEPEATYPRDTDLETFYHPLSSAGTRPAILSLVPSHCSSYIPKSLLPTFPTPLSFLHSSEYMTLEYHELLKVCESIEIIVTKEMAVAAEEATRNQSNS